MYAKGTHCIKLLLELIHIVFSTFYTKVGFELLCISPLDGGELVDGRNRRNNLRLQESQPKSLAIEVVSSQSKVSVSVDGTTVSHSTDTRITLIQQNVYQIHIYWKSMHFNGCFASKY
jgi:hypothetical protein